MLDKYPRRDVAYIATASGVTLVDRREPRVVDLDSLVLTSGCALMA